MTLSPPEVSSVFSALRSFSAVTKGAVGYRQASVSNRRPSASYRSSTSESTSAVVAKSLLVASLRKKGTAAPYCRAMAAISSSSVETMTSSNRPLCSAASML